MSASARVVGRLWVGTASSQPVRAAFDLCGATGRVPNVNGLGLDTAGVALGKDGAVIVDERCQTSVPSIHAVGDVTNRVQLTPVALGEAMVVDQLFGPAARKAARSMS